MKTDWTINDLQITTQKTTHWDTLTPQTPGGVNSGSPEGLDFPTLLVAPVVLLLLQTHWEVTNEERTGLWLRQTDHICHVVILTQIFSSFESSHDGDFRSDYVYLIARNPWLSSFLVSSNIRSRKSSSGISYQLRDIHSLYRCCWNKSIYFLIFTKCG